MSVSGKIINIALNEQKMFSFMEILQKVVSACAIATVAVAYLPNSQCR